MSRRPKRSAKDTLKDWEGQGNHPETGPEPMFGIDPKELNAIDLPKKGTAAPPRCGAGMSRKPARCNRARRS